MKHLTTAILVVVFFYGCVGRKTSHTLKELPPTSICFFGQATLYRTLLQQKTLDTQLVRESCQNNLKTPACEALLSTISDNKKKMLAIEADITRINKLPAAQRPPCNDANDLNDPSLVIAGDQEFQELVEKSRVFAQDYSPAHDCDDFSNDLVKVCSYHLGKAFEIYRFNFSCERGKKIFAHAITVAPVQWASGNIEYCAIEPQRNPSNQNLFDTCWSTDLGRKPPLDIVADLCLTTFQADKVLDATLGELGQPLLDPNDARLDPKYCSSRDAFKTTRACYNTCCFQSFRRNTTQHLQRENRYSDEGMNKYLGQCYAACDEVVPPNRQQPPAQRSYVGKMTTSF